jgi:hypothetical protein
MTKFKFRIRTRGGLVVDHITIAGRDQPDAERKLEQMYHGCQVLDLQRLDDPSPGGQADMDDILALIARQNHQGPSS